jgi:hypothetical protein
VDEYRESEKDWAVTVNQFCVTREAGNLYEGLQACYPTGFAKPGNLEIDA